MSEGGSPTPAAEDPKQTPEEVDRETVAEAVSPAVDPSVVDPSVVDPSVVDPPAAEASVAEPAVAESGGAEPGGAEVGVEIGVEEEADSSAEVPGGAQSAEQAGSPTIDPLDAELADLLRARMVQAVSTIEPRAGTLEYLHRAVPARRKRRQTALTTTAVTVFAVTAAVGLAGRGPLGGISGGSSDNGADVGNSLSASQRDSTGGGGANGTGSGSVAHTPVLAYPTPTAGTPSQPTHSPTFAEPPTGNPPSPAAPPNCQNSSMSSVVPTAGPTVNGVSYETVTATAATECSIAGPPQLTVLDAAGAVSSKVPIFKADGVAAPGLATVPTWGRSLVLKPGDRYQFQFAWVPAQCTVPPTSPPPTTPTTPPTSQPSGSLPGSAAGADASPAGPPATSSSAPPTTPSPSQSSTIPAPSTFTVAYSVYGAQPIANANFPAACGAAVYLTDIFQPGEFPAPHVGSGQAPQNPSPSA